MNFANVLHEGRNLAEPVVYFLLFAGALRLGAGIVGASPFAIRNLYRAAVVIAAAAATLFSYDIAAALAAPFVGSEDAAMAGDIGAVAAVTGFLLLIGVTVRAYRRDTARTA